MVLSFSASESFWHCSCLAITATTPYLGGAAVGGSAGSLAYWFATLLREGHNVPPALSPAELCACASEAGAALGGFAGELGGTHVVAFVSGVFFVPLCECVDYCRRRLYEGLYGTGEVPPARRPQGRLPRPDSLRDISVDSDAPLPRRGRSCGASASHGR